MLVQVYHSIMTVSDYDLILKVITWNCMTAINYLVLGSKVGTETSFYKIIKDNSCLFNLISKMWSDCMWSEVVI